MLRVSAFIDGFNLYHALKRLNGDHLLWVDLWSLMERQLLKRSKCLDAVRHFYPVMTPAGASLPCGQ